MRTDHVTTEPERAVLHVEGNPQILELNPGDHTATPWQMEVFTEENIDDVIEAAIAAGVLGWPPQWVQPVGTIGVYMRLDVVEHSSRRWVSTTDGNVWEPGVSGWRELAPEQAGPPPWIQPTGAHDAYALGDRVTHNGHVWESAYASNVWEPGVFGWSAIS